MINRIVIIGAGNAATCFAQAFHRAGLRVECVFARRAEAAETLASAVGAASVSSVDDIPGDADLYLLAVKDEAIAEIRLPDVSGIVVHCSGMTPMDTLHNYRKHGVLYPLQTLTRNAPVDFGSVPICIEASDPESVRDLHELACRLSETVTQLSTVQRQYTHLAAVFANNFTNHMLHIASGILAEQKLPFGLLMPLIRETLARVENADPASVQTGPARRHDIVTLQRHSDLLNAHPELQRIYELLTTHISDTYTPSVD